MTKKLLQLHLILFILLSGVAAKAWTLIGCHDGDTCTITDHKITKNIRFFGIDAPESDQPYGTDAKLYVESLLKNHDIEIKCAGSSYNRPTCAILVNKQDVQAALVKKGLAMDYPRFSRGRYTKLQEYAKQNRLGMWADANITSPFCWRWSDHSACKKDKLYQP
jgi:endonuclease YncB( thermonuclease family)